MKRNIFTAMMTILVIFASSCEEKEKINKTTNNETQIVNTEKDYDAYIEELMANTGIDIYEVSKLNVVKKISDKQLKIINISTAIHHTKGSITEEKLIQMKNLSTAIKNEYYAGNYEEALILYESFHEICMTIDGLSSIINEYGVQTFTYDTNSAPLYLPINWMEAEKSQAIELISTIEEHNPQFITLSEEQRIDILAAAITINMQQNTVVTKANVSGENSQTVSLADCEKSAKNVRGRDMGITTATYTASLAGCATCIHPFAIAACMAAQTGLYAYSMVGIQNSYNNSIELCRSKYGN